MPQKSIPNIYNCIRMEGKLLAIVDRTNVKFWPGDRIMVQESKNAKTMINGLKVKMVEIYESRSIYYLSANADDDAFGGFKLTIENDNLYIAETVGNLFNIIMNNYEYISRIPPYPFADILIYTCSETNRLPTIKYDPNMRCLTLNYNYILKVSP